jgi:hypothetical protein
MKRMVIVVAAMAMVAGVGMAAPLKGMQVWAAKAGTNGVANHLSSYGLTNAADRAAVAAGWDEGVLVGTALRESAYGLIAFAMARGGLAPANVARVKAAIRAESPVPMEVLEIVGRLPVAERGEFRAAVEEAGGVKYAKQPEFGRLTVKYTVLQGKSIYGAGVEDEERVRYLLAPESMTVSCAENCKRGIKERAIVLARLKLRAEGKSFVVKDRVNPLVAMVQPVVDALNAPECAGVEAAMRALGSGVPDLDRKALREAVTGWQPAMMAGEMGPGDVNQVLGKIAVVLGPDAYNRFVDAYNNGTAGVK